LEKERIPFEEEKPAIKVPKMAGVMKRLACPETILPCREITSA
jgi:hypothetical protein